MTAEASLTIGRMVLDLRAPEAEAERIARVAERDLPAALARVLAPQMTGEGVIHLPRLEITLDLDAAPGEAALARVWAEALGRAAAAAFAAPGEARARVFSDPADRLAAFVVSLIQGTAWSDATWRRYTGLKPLPTSIALRTALAEEPWTGRMALARLGPPERRRLWLALDAPDAKRLATALHGSRAAGGSGDIDDATLARAVEWRRTAPPPALKSSAHAILAFLADRAAETRGRGLGPVDRRALEALLAAPPQPSSSAAATTPGLQPEGEDRGCPAAAATGPTLSGNTNSVSPTPDAPHRSSAISEDSPPVLHTPFGGAFLLWPHLLAIPDVAVGTDDPTDRRRESLARALGEPDAARLADDPTLAALWAASPPSEVDPDEALRDWARAEGSGPGVWLALPDLAIERAEVTGYWLALAEPSGAEAAPEAIRTDAKALAARPGDRAALLAQIALRRLARRLPGFAEASVPFLREAVLGQTATVTLDGSTLTAGLGPAPLAVLLNLTGLSRQTHPLPGGRRLRLFPMEGAG